MENGSNLNVVPDDGYHEVCRIRVNTTTEILCRYFQETEDEHVVRCFSVRVFSLVDPIWNVGIAEAEPDFEDIEERLLDVLIQEGTYRGYWLQIKRAIKEFGREQLAWMT